MLLDVTVLVLIVVVPDTESVVSPVRMSSVLLPKTALPVMVKLFVPPTMVPLVVMVEPVSVVAAPRVTLPV